MKLVLASLTSVFLVAGCTTQPPKMLRYSRPETTQSQFMKDRYECLLESQQRVSGAVVNAYGGASNSEVVPSCGIWMACLGARGYVVDEVGTLSAPPETRVGCR